MSTNTLTIFSIVLALIFFGITIWLTLRRRYPGQITYFEESCIGLFDSIVRNLSDLKVLYKSDPVSENIVLLKGYIMNTGSKDITKDMVEEPLTLRLPEGFKWLDAKVVQSQTNLSARLTIKEVIRAEFDFGLFRVNEHVKFEALAEVPASESQNGNNREENAVAEFKKGLTVSHRIADTHKVLTNQLPTPLSFKDLLFILLIWSLLGLIAIGFALALLPTSGIFNQKELHYLITTQTGDKVEVKIEVARDGTIVTKGLEKPLEKRQSISEFFAGCNFQPIVGEQRSSYVPNIILFVIGSLILLYNISYWKQYRERRKIRRFLSLE